MHSPLRAQQNPQERPRLEAVDIGFQVEAARLLNSVSLSAGRGEFIGLIGPNGAGKTTLLKAISGLLPRLEGDVDVEGRPLAGMTPREVARLIGHVPQAAAIEAGFTCLELVLMGRYPRLGRFQFEGAADLRAAQEAMAVTETGQFSERPVSTLSGGERQRVLIARALAQEPCLLLLDEPTANLDIHHQIRVLELVRLLVSEGMTAIAAIHDLGLAARYCDRLVLLHRGRLLTEGAPAQVLTPATIREAFEVEAAVSTDPLTGTLAINLLPPAALNKAATKARVHVIAGGGRGARAMYLLQAAGYELTAGPLNDGDTDQAVAEMLGISSIAIPAFSPIDDESQRRHLELAAQARCVVLCDTPFGPGNLSVLDAAAGARSLVCLEERAIQERDFAGGEAVRRYERLVARSKKANISNLLTVVERELNGD